MPELGHQSTLRSNEWSIMTLTALFILIHYR